MNANEFRIGNWYSQFGNLHQVTWDTIKALGDAPETQLWCKPIPLSPEILEKYGYQLQHDLETQSHYFRNNILIIFDKNTGYCLYKRSLTTYTEIRFAHHLQNLHYALTGEELTYKQ
jgi:hypothetical protein